jgi:hypothetical protein
MNTYTNAVSPDLEALNNLKAWELDFNREMAFHNVVGGLQALCFWQEKHGHAITTGDILRIIRSAIDDHKKKVA